jgi:hypothetical protein
VVNGARPGVPSGARWSYEGFARALADVVEDKGACSPRAVSNWCKGRFVPREIEPILNVLFDIRTQGPERANLRLAYNLAVEESLREAKLAAAPGVWVPKGPRLVFVRKVQPGDAKAARDPMQAGLQAQVAEMARALGRESDRPSNTRLLPKLSVLAFALGKLLTCDPASMAVHLAEAYALLGRLGGILETDDAIRPDDSDAPLDTVTRGDLRDLIALGATWLRGHPRSSRWTIGRSRRGTQQAWTTRLGSCCDAFGTVIACRTRILPTRFWHWTRCPTCRPDRQDRAAEHRRSRRWLWGR